MRAVNLLPREAIVVERKHLTRALAPIGAAAVPVIAAGLVAIGYSSAHSLTGSRAKELANVEAAMPKTVPAAKVSSAAPELSMLNASIGARDAALTDALGKQMPWDTTLGDIARVIPAGVWLTSLSAASPTAPDTPAPVPAPSTATTTGTTTTTAQAPAPSPTPSSSAAFSISGSALTEDDVALLLTRLELLPSLANVTLGSTSSSGDGKKQLWTFNITANVQPPPTTRPQT